MQTIISHTFFHSYYGSSFTVPLACPENVNLKIKDILDAVVRKQYKHDDFQGGCYTVSSSSPSEDAGRRSPFC
jgi:hypothetical protein